MLNGKSIIPTLFILFLFEFLRGEKTERIFIAIMKSNHFSITASQM